MTTVNQKYMLDTSAFNRVLDGKTLPASFTGCPLLVTGIQAGELRATRNPERRAALLAVYEEIHPARLPASSFAFGIEGAGLGQARWNDGSGNVEKMLGRLQQLDLKKQTQGRFSTNGGTF
jgi:hypothetical protein